MPFLAEKRLVIVEGVPKSTKEEIQSLGQHIHPQTLLVFIDPKPDKRTAGVKELLASAEVKEFAPLKAAALRAWMNEYAKANGSSFAGSAAEQLVEMLGEDQDLIAQEISKLSLAAGKEPITIESIDMSVIPTDEGVVWKISDLLASGKKDDALKFAKRLIDRGGDAYGLWAILLNMLKNLTAVSAAVEAGHRSAKDIADATGTHIFAVRSLQEHAKRAKGEKLKTFLVWAADADKDLKTGVLRTTDEFPQELRSLIDRFIVSCP
jgi:DNA polymerase III delta subunit